MQAGEQSVSGDVATPTAAPVATGEAQNEGGEVAASGIFGSSNSGEDDKSRVLDEAERAFNGGNRWPTQETLALLKIRSDMDVAFRDATVKAPLWDEVSRKLGELGYNRSAKKCKEKFENVFKYHKRTKDGRTSKGQGKTYRYFDQLEAFQLHHHHTSSLHQSPSPKPQAPVTAAAVSLAMPAANTPITSVPSTTHVTVTTIPSFPSQATNINPTNYPSESNIPSASHDISIDLVSNSTSSSTSSDMKLEGRRKRKRKWSDVFGRLMKEVVDKQEELQKKFLEAIEKREHERMVRDEAWRMQEITRINREREILAQERSLAAAKDAAVMAFLQKLADQRQNPGTGQIITSNNILPPILPQPKPPPAPAPAPVQSQQSQPPQPQQVFSMGTGNGEQNNYMAASSSRWPKVEIEALIKLRTNIDSNYQENGPKGPLWEEISAGMRRLGYNRSAKRCKEKWENINKYFKKVKESDKNRAEDSKTCPYFHHLDALYKERNKHELFKPENSVPLMVQPEQQWPPDQEHHYQHRQQQGEGINDVESDQNVEDDDDEEDDRGGFEIVPKKQVNSMDANE